MSPAQSPVLAAGAVCWRFIEGKIRVLVVHRDRHDDVSFPKGKVDPGESLPQTAAREIEEETGLTVELGAPLGTTEYTLPGGREKVVHYWTVEVDDEVHEASTFEPNDEVTRLEWLSLKKARAALSYPHDREVLDRLQARIDNDTLHTFAIIALRHAKATPLVHTNGADAERPLLPAGKAEAKSAAPGVAAFGPKAITSSTAKRCRKTVEPLAKLTGLTVKKTEEISQDAYENGTDNVAKLVARTIERGRSTVLCSHGPVLPDIVSEIARQTNTPVDRSIRSAGMLPTAGYTVAHLVRGRPQAGIIALEVHEPTA